MRSRIFSSKYIKTVSKGQAWIPAFLTLGFILAFPVIGLEKLGSWRNLGYTQDQITLLYYRLWKDGFVLTGMAVAMAAGFMNAVNGFLYLYSRKKTDFYHSLPMKRSELFAEKAVMGLIYYLVPYIVIEFLTVCVGAARGLFSLELMGMAVKMLCLHLLVYLMIYFSVVLVLCITGNMLMGILTLGGMYLYGIALEFVLAACGLTFLDTFIDKRYGIMAFLLKDASPAAFAFSLADAYSAGHAAKYLVALVILIVVLAVLSWIAYEKRPSEAAGRSMVYRWVAVLVKFMVVIPTGLAVGWIFYPQADGGTKLIWWVFGLILGTVLSHGMIEIIYHMSFQKFFAKKMQLVLAGVLVFGCAMIYQKDLLHFDSYLPKQEELASVNISNGYDQDYYAHIEKAADGEFYDLTDNYNWYDPANALTGADGIGDETYEALENIVKDSLNVDKAKKRSYFISVKYTLKSGRVVCRGYWADVKNLRTLMKGLYAEENLKEKKYEFLDLDEKYLTTIGMTDACGMGYSIFQNDDRQKQELLDALKKDIESASAEDMMEEIIIQLDFNYALPVRSNINSFVPGKNNEEVTYVDWNLGVPPSFKNTLAILKKTGYPLTIEELDINKISLTYYEEENISEQEEFFYTKPEEIKAIQNALVLERNAYAGGDTETVSNVAVAVYMEQGEMMNSLFLKRADVPDFVLDKMQELGISPEFSDNSDDDGDTMTTYQKTINSSGRWLAWFGK